MTHGKKFLMTKIVGNGLLGRSFLGHALPNVLYFCSGVANSQEVRESAFKRERQLLLSIFEETKGSDTFIYFSSVLAPTRSNNYYKHKMEMEQLVRVSFPDSYLIVRLPQVVGLVDNSTLFSDFIKRLALGLEVTIYKNASRSLIDIDDVVRVSNDLVSYGVKKTVIEVCSTESLNVLEMVEIMDRELGRVSEKIYVEGGSVQNCSPTMLREILKEKDALFMPGYTKAVIEKYTLKLRDIFITKPNNL